jgi:toxin HigB-1
MISSFRGRISEDVFHGQFVKGLENAITQRAKYKLDMINAATTLLDLKNPPGNHLEALKGDRKGQHSIRINQKWRICFKFESGQAHNVEIIDYH